MANFDLLTKTAKYLAKMYGADVGTEDDRSAASYTETSALRAGMGDVQASDAPYRSIPTTLAEERQQEEQGGSYAERARRYARRYMDYKDWQADTIAQAKSDAYANATLSGIPINEAEVPDTSSEAYRRAREKAAADEAIKRMVAEYEAAPWRFTEDYQKTPMSEFSRYVWTPAVETIQPYAYSYQKGKYGAALPDYKDVYGQDPNALQRTIESTAQMLNFPTVVRDTTRNILGLETPEVEKDIASYLYSFDRGALMGLTPDYETVYKNPQPLGAKIAEFAGSVAPMVLTDGGAAGVKGLVGAGKTARAVEGIAKARSAETGLVTLDDAARLGLKGEGEPILGPSEEIFFPRLKEEPRLGMPEPVDSKDLPRLGPSEEIFSPGLKGEPRLGMPEPKLGPENGLKSSSWNNSGHSNIIDETASTRSTYMAKETSAAELQGFARANNIHDFSGDFDDVAKFCDYRRDLAEELILSTKEAIGGKTATEVAEMFKLPERPAPNSLSNYRARVWYLWQESQIRGGLDFSQPLERVARQAFDRRNYLRTTTRESMADREMAEHLFKKEKNKTWEELVDKQIKRGFLGDAIYIEIIKDSMRSRGLVDGWLKIKKMRG
ncbi:MAG: hypothetical protein HPY50_04765 [Firmicutes bacterium]|nr:hypothetical protein [Bacillota bacterium]